MATKTVTFDPDSGVPFGVNLVVYGGSNSVTNLNVVDVNKEQDEKDEQEEKELEEKKKDLDEEQEQQMKIQDEQDGYYGLQTKAPYSIIA